MFFWVDFSSWWSSIISVVGLCIALLIVWLAIYIVYRLFTDNRIQRPARNNAGAIEPRGFIARMTIHLGTGLGLLCSRGPNANNRRAKAILVLLALGTVYFGGYLFQAYHNAQPNGLRDAVFTETFGQKPLTGTSMTRSAYIPNPDEFYQTAPQPISTTSDRPATSLLWLIFWLLALLPLLWAIGILYFVLALREETWNGARSMVAKLRDWISNMGESGISGARSTGGAQGGLSFSAPIIMTTSGAAVAEADKPKVEVPWAKIMQWVKRNSGEIVAGLFVIDELLELGAVRKKHRTPKD